LDAICIEDISAVLRATDLGWINAAHTQNFEISRANSGVKKIIFSVQIFVKMLDGSNFGKRCLLGCSI
jgi:hypothetical protein